MRIAITGAAGRIGTVLRAGLVERYQITSIDVAALTDPRPGETTAVARVEDLVSMVELFTGCDGVVHLAGIPDEAPFRDLMETNIEGTRVVLEAARLAGVRRVVFASSNHVVGFYTVEEVIDADAVPRPDTLYGVSKAAGEALGRYYHHKWGLEVVCLRIGSFRGRPEIDRHLSTWISHRDMVHLVDRSLRAQNVGFLIAYGVSRNQRSWWNNDVAYETLGYDPRDDAELFADSLRPDPSEGIEYHGGDFTRRDYPPT